jgi:transcription initiation factor TFIIIB Brf1 subunit/transcription initiation factor TFIIB
MASKTVTFEEAEAKRQKAVDFLNRIGDADAANDFANMSTQDYINHKGLRIVNNNRRRNCLSQTKTDLQDVLDQVQGILASVHLPEATREDAMAAIGDALDQIEGDNGDDLDDDYVDDLDDDDDVD